jgi:diguanylate cyclase (GGDEF)-like protein/putative nucleotidyltransferase with HDIG domain
MRVCRIARRVCDFLAGAGMANRFRFCMSVEKKDIGHLPMQARVYIAGMAAAAVVIWAHNLASWQPVSWGPFLLYLAAAMLGANLKVSLPGITGTLSVNYLFIFTAAIELSPLETLAIGCASGMAQLLWGARRRPRPIQMLFTLSAMSAATNLTYVVAHFHGLGSSVPARLMAACTVYFLSNTGSVGLIIAFTEGKNFFRLWKDNFFWTAPHYLVGGTVAGVFHVINRQLGWQSELLAFPTAYLVYRSYRLYLARLAEEKRHVGEMADLHLRTIQALALAIDARDGNTFGHLCRVQVYARELARELGLPEYDRLALEAAALLHDIGKLAVPEHIISKPGKLTPEEFEKMKVHPVVGAEILESVRFPYPVVPIVRCHHEKWDGTGYPSGLGGEEIPMGARILSAVDCLDALASDRQYRRALPLDEAMRKIAAESGTSFDPRVVDVLKRRYVELEVLARKQTAAPARLSTATRVEKGEPGAGLETSALSAAEPKPGFVASIAAARQEFQTLLELTHELGNSLRVEDTLALLASRLKPVIPYHAIAIYCVQGGRLVTRYASGEDAALFQSLEIPLGEGISGWVTQNNKPIVNGNPSVEPGYLNDPAKFSVHRSAVSVPLPGIAGVIGALTLYHREAGAFSRDHLRMLLAISSKAGLTIENALRFVEAEEIAVTDALTGLPNARSLFLRLDEALNAARESASRLVVLVTDIDGFKQVNDRLGHAAGNQMLERTAQAIREAFPGDYVARMGGDEFVMLCCDAGWEDVEKRLKPLNALVAQAAGAICPDQVLRLSVGAAYFPEDGRDAEELLAVADARMYEMKRHHHAEAGSAAQLGQLAAAIDSSAGSVYASRDRM